MVHKDKLFKVTADFFNYNSSFKLSFIIMSFVQECAPGFLRVPDSGTALGRCTRCNCNGHASTCDPVTGQCLVC